MLLFFCIVRSVSSTRLLLSIQVVTYLIFVLLVIIFFEISIFLDYLSLPSWVFPNNTPCEMVGTANKLYPTVIYGLKCIIGSFFVDIRIKQLQLVKDIRSKNAAVSEKTINLVKSYITASEPSESSDHVVESDSDSISQYVSKIEWRIQNSAESQAELKALDDMVDSFKTNLANARLSFWDRYQWISYLAAYIVIFMFYHRYIKTAPI